MTFVRNCRLLITADSEPVFFVLKASGPAARTRHPDFSKATWYRNVVSFIYYENELWNLRYLAS